MASSRCVERMRDHRKRRSTFVDAPRRGAGEGARYLRLGFSCGATVHLPQREWRFMLVESWLLATIAFGVAFALIVAARLPVPLAIGAGLLAFSLLFFPAWRSRVRAKTGRNVSFARFALVWTAHSALAIALGYSAMYILNRMM